MSLPYSGHVNFTSRSIAVFSFLLMLVSFPFRFAFTVNICILNGELIKYFLFGCVRILFFFFRSASNVYLVRHLCMSSDLLFIVRVNE